MSTLTPTRQHKPGPRAAADSTVLDLFMLPERRDWKRFQAFCAHFLRHPDGSHIKLKPFQLEIVKGILPSNLAKRPAMALLSVARGQGKTELSSWLAAYALFADTVQSPEVLVVASSLEQAQRQIFRRVVRLIEAHPELAKRARISRDTISTPWNGGTLTALASTEASLQGWQHSAAFLDELHVTDDVVWESVVTASLKRPNSLTMAISTPPANAKSVMKTLAEKAKKEPDARFYYREWAGDIDHDPLCEHCIRSARPLTGASKSEIAGLASLLKKVPESTFKRLMLGVWDVPTDEQWLSLGQLEPLRTDRKLSTGDRCVIAFDGSRSGDMTGILAVTIEPKPHIIPLQWWQPGGGKTVPVAEVEDALRAACALYRVDEIICDSFGWAKVLSDLSAEGLPIVDHPQSSARMSPSTVALHGAINDQSVTISDDPKLLEHLLNSRLRSDDRGTRIAKESNDSTNRIDLAVCAVMGYSRALHYLNKKQTSNRVTSWRYT